VYAILFIIPAIGVLVRGDWPGCRQHSSNGRLPPGLWEWYWLILEWRM